MSCVVSYLQTRAQREDPSVHFKKCLFSALTFRSRQLESALFIHCKNRKCASEECAVSAAYDSLPPSDHQFKPAETPADCHQRLLAKTDKTTDPYSCKTTRSAALRFVWFRLTCRSVQARNRHREISCSQAWDAT